MAFIDNPVIKPVLNKFNEELVEYEPLGIQKNSLALMVNGSIVTTIIDKICIKPTHQLNWIENREPNEVREYGLCFMRTIGHKQGLWSSMKTIVYIDSLGKICVKWFNNDDCVGTIPYFTQRRKYWVLIRTEGTNVKVSYSLDNKEFVEIANINSQWEDDYYVSFAGETIKGAQWFIDECFIRVNSQVVWKGGRNIIRLNPGLILNDFKNNSYHSDVYITIPVMYNEETKLTQLGSYIHINKSYDRVYFSDYDGKKDLASIEKIKESRHTGILCASDDDRLMVYVDGEPYEEVFKPVAKIVSIEEDGTPNIQVFQGE